MWTFDAAWVAAYLVAAYSLGCLLGWCFVVGVSTRRRSRL